MIALTFFDLPLLAQIRPAAAQVPVDNNTYIQFLNPLFVADTNGANKVDFYLSRSGNINNNAIISYD